MMNEKQLRLLLDQQEVSTVDYKREWYKVDKQYAQKTRIHQKGEMIKDILALANGNTSVAGETSYLIIGADDEAFDEQGHRVTYNILKPESIKDEYILSVINKIATPSLPDLRCSVEEIDGNRLVVITIPPSSDVHEINQRLKTSKGSFDAYTVFVRHGSRNDTASTKERFAIADLKKLKSTERRHVPPIPFGAAIGAIIGGMLLSRIAGKIERTKESSLAGLFAGIFAGGLSGGMLGNIYHDFRKTKHDWSRMSLENKILSVSTMPIAGIIYWVVYQRLQKRN